MSDLLLREVKMIIPIKITSIFLDLRMMTFFTLSQPGNDSECFVKISNNSICSGFLSSTIEPKIPRDLSSRLPIVPVFELGTTHTIDFYKHNKY